MNPTSDRTADQSTSPATSPVDEKDGTGEKAGNKAPGWVAFVGLDGWASGWDICSGPAPR